MVPIEFVVNMMKKSVEIVSVQTHGLKPIVGIEKNWFWHDQYEIISYMIKQDRNEITAAQNANSVQIEISFQQCMRRCDMAVAEN